MNKLLMLGAIVGIGYGIAKVMKKKKQENGCQAQAEA